MLQIIQITFLFLGSIFITYVSRKSLLNLKTHGFNRFFVFESCLLLVLLNLPYWITNPLSLMQLISWMFLIISLYLLFLSTYSLKSKGGSRAREGAAANYKFENTTVLLNDGIYKYIRHPMYSSLLFLILGAMLKNVSVGSVLLACISIVFLIFTAGTEEKENIEYFGASYSEYMKSTKMFIPFIF